MLGEPAGDHAGDPAPLSASAQRRDPEGGGGVLPDATLFGPGIIRLADGRVLAESLERVGVGPYGEATPTPPPTRVFETAVHVSKRGSDNYGHFLVEVLPRLVINAGAYPADAPILIDERSRPFAPPILEEAGIDPARVEWIGDEPVLVKRLYWPTRTTFHRLRQLALTCSRSCAIWAGGSRAMTSRRRAGSSSAAATREHGSSSTTTRPSRSSSRSGSSDSRPATRRSQSRSAPSPAPSFVVAVGGAALTNMVFMPPGGTIVMIGPATMAGYFFWDLATHCDQQLIVMWGENEDPSAGGKNTDFRVDAAAARRGRRRGGVRARRSGEIVKLARAEVLEGLLALYEDPAYLEVGVSKGVTFHAIRARRKVAVDPRFRFKLAEARRENPEAEFHEVPSDEYFGQHRRSRRAVPGHLPRRSPHARADVARLHERPGVPGARRSDRDRRRLSLLLRRLDAGHRGTPRRQGRSSTWPAAPGWETSTASSSSSRPSSSSSAIAPSPRTTASSSSGEPAGQAVPQRRVEDVGRLPYERVALDEDVFAFTPYAEILDEVRAAVAQPAAR